MTVAGEPRLPIEALSSDVELRVADVESTAERHLDLANDRARAWSRTQLDAQLGRELPDPAVQP